MRYTLIVVIIGLIFWGCKKDKFTTVPQISFKSIDPNVFSSSNIDPNSSPSVIFNLTDAEGDFSDTVYAYIKNISTAPFKLDSIPFPVLTNLRDRKNLNVDVSVKVRSILASSGRPNPHVDTLQFEVYVKDNAKNKSNVITAGPLYYTSP